jgi:HK97 family phage major capsid protein
MTWETLVKHLRSEGYEGDETLEAVAKHLDDSGLDPENISDAEGNEVAVKTLWDERARSRMDIGSTQLAEENAALREQLAEKEVEDELVGRKTAIVTNARDRSEDDQTFGFNGLGDFFKSVKSAAIPGGNTDDRLNKASLSSYANEGVGADGGYLVPTEYADRIFSNVWAEDGLLAQTDQLTISRNSMTFVVDESTPWGSSGVQTYWVEESNAITQSKPQLKYDTLRLSKIAALCPATDELLSDANAAGTLLADRAGDAIRYAVEDAVLHGTGAGQPLGVMNAGCLVTVAKEGSQSADTIQAENILKMYARMMHRPNGNAVWIINADCLPQLFTMSLNNNPLYLPSMQVADAPYGTLFGRPLIISQHANTLGDLGDVIFADLSQYVTVVKSGGVESARSMHLWFDQGVEAFRFSMRIAGQPWMGAAVDSDNSADDVSPFVTLAERA